MSKQSRKENIENLRYHYQRSRTRKEKSKLLDIFCKAYGHERKYAIRLLSGKSSKKKVAVREKGKRGGSCKKYTSQEVMILKELWMVSEQPCGKRLKSVIALYLPSWEKKHGEVSEGTRKWLLEVSAAQMDRILKRYKCKGKRIRKNNEVLRQIAVRTGPWEVTEPGWLEADTVAHCGESMRGPHAWTLTMTDIFSGWTETRGVWSRSELKMFPKIREIRESLPMKMLGFDSDNGGEFINQLVVHWLKSVGDAGQQVLQTRSRPYKKKR